MSNKKSAPQPLDYVPNRPLIVDDSIKNADYIIPDWLTPPEHVNEGDITATFSADVVIAGAGLSGLCAAVRAAENGASVIVCEKTATCVGRGGMFGSTNSSLMRKLGVELDKEQIAREWILHSGSRCREDLVWHFVNKSGEALDWLIDILDKEDVHPTLFGGHYKGPYYTEYAGTHLFGPGPNCKYKQMGTALITAILKDRAESLGVKFLFKTPAYYLEKTGDRVSSVIAESEDGYVRLSASKGVILACGDISENHKMMAYYAPFALKPARTACFPPNVNTGDGHKMGLWAGGAVEDGHWPTMVHLVGCGVYTFAFLFVNRLGNRFMNEDSWIQGKSLQCLSQPKGEYAWSVFDSKWVSEVEKTVDIGGGQFWDSFSRMYGQKWTPESSGVENTVAGYIENGVAVTADTIEELAEKMDVPVDALRATVNRYNELYDMGYDADYGKRKELLTSIKEPPYFAIKWAPALLAVTGGLNTDVKMRVLNKDGEVVDGLYAVGNNAGGLYGMDYPVIISGNSHGKCVLWGITAADSCTK